MLARLSAHQLRLELTVFRSTVAQSSNSFHNATGKLATSEQNKSDFHKCAPYNYKNGSNHSIRQYHFTSKQEILPLLAVGAAGLIIRYSYKAMKRMDEEYDDYSWELQQYEKRLARTQPKEAVAKAVAIDLGTVYTKLATSHPQPEVIVSREGDRAVFNGIVYRDGNVERRGRAALETHVLGKQTTNSVVMPWSLLNEKSDQDSAKVVTDSLAYALSEAIERLNYKNTNDDEPLRKVVTYPVQQIHSMDSTYSQSFEIILSTPTITLLPDPVAAIWGAQTRNLLPTDQDTPHTFLVIDVGGSTTQVSVVQKDIARGYLSVPWGGETFIRLLIDYLLQEGQPNGGSNNQRVTDARSLSAIQLQARAAVAELSNKMRVGVHVPYLFADPKHHHLDTTVSRTVLEHAVNNHIQHELVASIQDSAVLSPHLPVPTNVNSLFTSLLTQTLEYANKMPSDIHNVLLIGGASKAPMVQAAMNHALLAVMGPQGPAKLASMDQVLSTELTVLGAATMLPYWTYSVEHGLKVEG